MVSRNLSSSVCQALTECKRGSQIVVVLLNEEIKLPEVSLKFNWHEKTILWLIIIYIIAYMKLWF